MTLQPRLRHVAVVTGSRAEFGLLAPVMHAIRKHPRLRLGVIAAGSHFLPPQRTIRDVRDAFPIAAQVRMQEPGRATRLGDAAATGRGIEGFARAFARLKPDWVVILGDRIEAFAAAAAASIGGLAVAHIHGGDRAEGIADEAMRHAVTKLAHLHLPATEQSAERIRRMGERPEHVRVVGSPAVDGLSAIKPMTAREAAALGAPRTIVLLHPSGLPAAEERRLAASAAGAVRGACVSPVLVLAPNHDPGREIIIDAFAHGEPNWTYREHLPRGDFLRLLRRLATASPRGVLVGNSSAGLIEAAALRLPVVTIGPRQNGRERAANVFDVPVTKTRLADRISDAIAVSFQGKRPPAGHPYGNGLASLRIAAALADPRLDPRSPALLRKRNTY